MKVLGVIPARGWSKGIPRKNLYPLRGKALIRYTLEAGNNSKLDDVIVTTDDPEIAWNLEHSIIRPPELATDEAPMLPVIQHAVEVYGKPIDAVMILQPTSPLRTAQDINNALSFFYNTDSLVSVCEGIHPMKSYDEDGKPFMEQTAYDRHRNKCYTRNGAIFLLTTDLLKSGRLFNDRPLLYIMPKLRSIDIDSMEDMKMAEAILKSRGEPD